MFADFKIDIYIAKFGQVRIDPTRVFFTNLDRSQLFYWVRVRHAAKNNSKPFCLIKIQEPRTEDLAQVIFHDPRAGINGFFSQ